MDKRVPFFFSAFCSMMVGSTVLHTTAGVMLAGVGASAAERVQAMFTAANASGFSAPEIAPLGEIKAIKTGYAPQASANAVGTDKVMVAIADAVSARGESAVLDRKFVRDLKIPITQPGNDPLPIKRLQMDEPRPNNRVLHRTAIIVVTDKRYLIMNVETGDGSSMSGTANDESATIIGGRVYKPVEQDLDPASLTGVYGKSRAFWAEQLVPTQTASTGA